METIFETGATTQEINNLILFADNTRELALIRDEIYIQGAKSNLSGFFSNGECRDILQKQFNRLLYKTIERYAKEFPDDQYSKDDLSYSQKEEFCTIYANDFENWKKEKGL